ncbi:MAG: rRNA pseudouridine synthase [Bacteroidia bacterium]|nr:rRNA pseudouridine synthase [Bacteroidia bacterium]
MRRFDKKHPNKRRNGANRSRPEERAFGKPSRENFRRSSDKKKFNPNKDLDHGQAGYSERKRENLLADKRKQFGKPSRENFRRSSDKKKFNPNKDLDHGQAGYSERKRENLLADKRKSFGKPSNKFRSAKPSNEDSAHQRKDWDERTPFRKQSNKKRYKASYKKLTHQNEIRTDGLTRLNKYIANAGICSRREADELIRAGAVSVNGKVITEMGYKVKPDDVINYGGETLRTEKKVYVLLNKPKDFITTLDDPGNRKTVFDLVRNACKERVYPVGRLDRNTTGVLLLTNDGDLTKKLTHPKHGIKKVYHVTLDKPLSSTDLAEIANKGVLLDDGLILPDAINYAGDGAGKKEIGIEIHSGRNRIVRRLFEHFGYTVVKLDRVVFAGLTKKELSRGRWRLLSEKEVSFLKMLG